MFVIYFLVCGGAYGSEDLGSTLPPLYSLLGIVLVPWLFGFPLAMLTAELASAMPDAEGFMLWTESEYLFPSFRERKLALFCRLRQEAARSVVYG